MKRLVGILLIAILASHAMAQESDPGLLTLERIFKNNEFRSERFGPAKWLAASQAYTTLELAQEAEGFDLVKYAAESGERTILVPAAQFIPPGSAAPLTIDDYEWSGDGRKLLIFTNSQRVWRLNTRGDYWVLDLSSGQMRQLGQGLEPSSLMFCKFSPDGRKAAYVCNNDLHVEEIASSRRIRLTFDGSRTTINGTFDWVYEEEFQLRDGFRWSPDGTSIAYWQLDSKGVRDFYLINNTDSLYSRIIPVPYPKVGMANSAYRIGVVPACGGATTWMRVPGDPRNTYVARMEWAADSRELALQHLNRPQNTLQIMLCEAATGAVRTLFTDRDSAWVDTVNEWEWLAQGRQLLWLSERDGWRHAWLIARKDGVARCITPGSCDVMEVIDVDEKGGWLYFMASPENATQKYLYRSALSGKGAPQRLSPMSQPGTHRYQLSTDAHYAIHTWSRFGQPPVTELVKLPGHEVVRTLAANMELAHKVAALRQTPVEFFRIDIGDGITLDGFCQKPPDMQPGKKYPALIYVYGEPWGQTVLDSWRGNQYLWHLMLAQQGYVILSFDNRGTPAPRGRAWRKCVHGKIGILASADQAAALRTVQRWSFIDSERIGVWGWSGGGSMTLNLLFRHPQLYHAGMAVAPVTDERYYDTIYQERYMGLLEENEEGYREGSPITHASGLEGHLLLVHGTGDDNCHYQTTELLINELIKHNKPFTMMAYPNRSHSINEGEGTSLHLYGLLTRFLVEHLPSGAR